MKDVESAIVVVQRALDLSRRRLAEAPEFNLYQSCVAQMEYLADVLAGRADRSRLRSVIVGVFAAKEFDTSDPEFAEALSEANSVVDRLLSGLK